MIWFQSSGQIEGIGLQFGKKEVGGGRGGEMIKFY